LRYAGFSSNGTIPRFIRCTCQSIRDARFRRQEIAMRMHTVYLLTIPVLWTAFGISLLLPLSHQKPGVRHESRASWLVHNLPIIVTLLLVGLPRLPGNFLSGRFLRWHPANFWIGASLVLAGLGLAIYARLALKGNWSITVEVKRRHELICSGPYRWVRHPIYAGLLLAFAGTALTIGQWSGIVGLLIVYVTLRLKSRVEERYMLDTFGDRYRQYQREVPALVPFPRWAS
jgi:protein-S-isoprenylcysteine O-methyltransferase Ste14